MPNLFFLNVIESDYWQMAKLFKSGFSANAVQELSSKYLSQGYRRSTVQAVRRDVLNLVKKEAYISALLPDEKPRLEAMMEVSLNRGFKYRYFGSVDVINPISGEITQQSWSYYSDRLLTSSEAEKEAKDILDPTNYENIISFENLKLRQVQHNANYPY